MFVCHDPKPVHLTDKISTMSRSQSAINNSSRSDDDHVSIDYDLKIRNHPFLSKDTDNVFRRRFRPSNEKQRSSKPSGISFPTMIHNSNNNEIERESLIRNNSATKQLDKDEYQRSNRQLVFEEIDVDIDNLINDNQPSASIVYFSSLFTKPMSNIVSNTNK